MVETQRHHKENKEQAINERRRRTERLNVNVVDQYRPAGEVHQTEERHGNGRLSGARPADNSNLLSGIDLEGETVQDHRRVGRVADRELNREGKRRKELRRTSFTSIAPA